MRRAKPEPLTSVKLSLVSQPAKAQRGRPSRKDVWLRILPKIEAELRRMKGTAVAEQIGVSGGAVSQYLSGKIAPEAWRMVSLIRLAGKNPSDLVPELFGKDQRSAETRDQRWVFAVLKRLNFPEEVAVQTALQMALEHEEDLSPDELLGVAVDLAEVAVAEKEGQPAPLTKDSEIDPSGPSTVAERTRRKETLERGHGERSSSMPAKVKSRRQAKPAVVPEK